MDAAKAPPAVNQRGAWLAISAATVGSYCALVLAVANVAFAAILVFLPAGIWDLPSVLFQAGTQPRWYQALYAVWALTGLLGLAIVSPVTSLLVPRNTGLTDWAVRIAYVGFALTLVQSIHEFVNVPQLGQLYHGCGTCTASLADQQTLAKWLYASMFLDPWNWLTVGGVGLWIVVVSGTGLSAAGMNRPVLYLGIGAGVLYLAVAVAGSFNVPADILVLLAAILAAAWYAWVGLLLRGET